MMEEEEEEEGEAGETDFETMEEKEKEEEEAVVRGLGVMETEIRLVPVSKPTCIRRVPSLIDSPITIMINNWPCVGCL